MYRFIAIVVMMLIVTLSAMAATYYVATNGNDSNTGLTIDQPFATLSTAFAKIVAGDTIIIRGGTYANSSTISIPKITGTDSSTHCYLLAYTGERPVFDFTAQKSSDGIKLIGSYWYVKGIESMKAYHNGMAIYGNYNTVEYCSVHDNRNAGMQFTNGASYNRIINCDAYCNYDSSTLGANADGFSPKLDVGTGNYFYGCRSWLNSDDGWDGYLRPSNDVTTTIENCWSWKNGYLKDGVTTLAKMNGNGFKLGGSDTANLKHNMIVKNCLAFLNKAKGFDQNHTRGSVTLLNCTSYNNGIGTSGGAYNFSIPETLATTAGKLLTVKNCLSYVTTKAPGYSFGAVNAVILNNSWNGFSISDADFISLDTTGVSGPRQTDGSLPVLNFMHLASSSSLIDAGVDVGLPYNGSAPDLGCFETSGITGITTGSATEINDFQLAQNYPNPFNPSTVISYSLPVSGSVSLKVFDVLGREAATLVNEQKFAGTYTATFNAAHLSSGVYFYQLKTGNYTATKKLLLLK
jgi:hypothetical protein